MLLQKHCCKQCFFYVFLTSNNGLLYDAEKGNGCQQRDLHHDYLLMHRNGGASGR